MHIKRLTITNFRGLERVSFEAGTGLNVIAGPNAVGKTTILEAIRLAKALLAPRFQGEAQQVLSAMGAVNAGVISLNAPFAMLANDASKPITIDMQLLLHESEVSTIKSSVYQLAVMMLQTELARSINENALDLAQYLSTVDGQSRLSANRNLVLQSLTPVTVNHLFSLSVTLDVATGNVRGSDPNSQAFITFLERTLPPNKANFNYFTADRALPAGEVGIQFGPGEVQQQIISYIAQPALKWQRVKQLIIQTMLLNKDGTQNLINEFNLIFDELLPGKKLSGVFMNEHNVLRVLVEDKESGKIFDIDQMSSGEKGLVLTFLTLRLSSKNDSIVLLDEPELHLNAAVCTGITRYLLKHCVEDMGMQLFVCSHSPEIVRDAFESESSKLFHLRSAVDLSPVYQQDSREVFEILNRLGASTADVLFSRGAVFVEGEHDAAILQAGYPDILQGYKVQALGGRSEVEKEIPKLQKQEMDGNLDKNHLFIFDRDRRISNLTSSKFVKVYQLERYCIENYLLDETILYDIISLAASNPPASRGEFAIKIEELALGQLSDHVIGEIYRDVEPTNAGLRPKEIHNLNFIEAADSLWARISDLRDEVAGIDETDWKTNFIEKCEAKKADLEMQWKSDWRKLANGKILFDDLYQAYGINIRKVEFKKQIVIKMAAARDETWRILNSVLNSELNQTNS